MDGLYVKRVGRGPRVLLLHGGVLAGEPCWTQQLRAIRAVRRRPWEGQLPVGRLAGSAVP
jgi:hypothetical protein